MNNKSTKLFVAVQRAIDNIEEEMKRIGMWQGEPLPPEKLVELLGDFDALFGG